MTCNRSQSGQSLSEMLILMPLFLTVLAGVIASTSSLGWRGALSEGSLSLQLGYPSPNIGAGRPQKNESSNPLSSLTTGRNERLGRFLPSPPRAAFDARNDPREGTLEWKSHLITLKGAGSPFAKRHSDSLAQLANQSPRLQERADPVFDASPFFIQSERKDWPIWTLRNALTMPSYFRFKSSIAMGGSPADEAPFNLARDCLFSDQGWHCPTIDSRRQGPANELLWEQRRRAAAVQISACSIELCARSLPSAITCPVGVVLTTAQSLVNSSPDPAQCPLSRKSIEALHSAVQKSLDAWGRSVHFQEACIDPERRARRLTHSHNDFHSHSLCPLNAFDPRLQVSSSWTSMVDSIQGLY